MLTITRSVGAALAGVVRRDWVATGVPGPTGLMTAWAAASPAQARTTTATLPRIRTAGSSERRKETAGRIS
jgi:hypothetical protein